MVEKTERITVRFTPKQEEWVIKEAEKIGVSKGRYLRMVALVELPQANTPFFKKNQRMNFKGGVTWEEMKKIIEYHIPTQGNNLNQLTRHVNETRQIDRQVLKEITRYRKDNSRLVKTIVRALP